MASLCREEAPRMQQKADVFKLLGYLASSGLYLVGTLLASAGKTILILLLSPIRKGKSILRWSTNTTKQMPVHQAFSSRIHCEKFIAVSIFHTSSDIVKNGNGHEDLLIHPIDEKIVNSVTRACGQQENQIKAMEIHFPEEIITDILSRLPVPSLLRFKCVSKSWKTLISEPYFKTKHLNHAQHNQNSQKFLIVRRGPEDICCLSLSFGEEVQKLDLPSDLGEYNISCCYEGLSLLACKDCTRLLLWNPFTRESLVLPCPEIPTRAARTYGLGYDSTSDDYLIFTVADTWAGIVPNEILALKSGSWRTVDAGPRLFRREMHDGACLPFLHGAFHWIGLDKSSGKYNMVSFNASTEVYKLMPLPQQCFVFSDDWRVKGVSVLGGQLSAYCTVMVPGWITFRLWAMKVYGDAESWTELFKIRDTNFYLIEPVYMLADGEVIVHYGGIGVYYFVTSKGDYYEVFRGSDQEVFLIRECLTFPAANSLPQMSQFK